MLTHPPRTFIADRVKRWTADEVKALREELHVTQEELARAVGVSFATLSRWENGHNLPSRLACDKLTELANGGSRGAGD